MDTPRLARGLGLKEALAIVLGTVVGSGIFFKPNVLAASLGRLGEIMAVWLVGGALSAMGSLVYAELATMMPESGGAYVYIREAYGRFFAFLLGWTSFWLARSAAVAAMAVAAATMVSQIVSLSPAAQRGLAVGLIVFFAAINVKGVHLAGVLQDLATFFKAAGLAVLSAVPFLLIPLGLPGGSVANWSSRLHPAPGGLAAAFFAVLWAYDGWYNVTVVAEEVRDPRRDLPRALVLGVAAVTGLYLLANLSFYYVLPMKAIAHSNQVATDVARAVMGKVGATVVAVLVLGSVLGTLNADMLCGPRVFFAMARDGLFFTRLGEVHPRWRTPTNAILAFSAWTIALVAAGDTFTHGQRLFDVLTDYVIFAVLIFSIMAAGAIFILRARRPEADRPYRCWGYPWVPGLFLATMAWLLGLTFMQSPAQSLIGLALVGLAGPAYFFWGRSRPTGS